MPKKKEKLKGVTFQLVHRSQQDPLVADETAPQRVLVPLTGKETKAEKEKRIEEQHKYGIYFDDDYNYLQHLKDPKDYGMEWPEHIDEEVQKRKEEKYKIKLPSSVFASTIEEEVGMLNKAVPISGPQLDLDPDIVAAMDDDFDYDDPENQLEDNFIELAEGVSSTNDYFDENDEDNYEYSDYNSEGLDDVRSLGSEQSFSKEETKSRFTNYSMTSSVMRRNDQLTLLDDRFEKMYADYDENEIGALDTEEIEGHVLESSDILLQYAEEFAKQQTTEQLSNEKITNKTQEFVDNESDNESEDEMKYIQIDDTEKWDCETILSTYSNIYNHPKLIVEPSSNKIKIDKKTGLPKNILGANKLTTKALNELNAQNGVFQGTGSKSVAGQSIISQLSHLSIRPKNEQPKERRDRKKALKEYKRERRLEKKLNTKAFKEEAQKQAKIAINNRNNVQGNRIL